jgi:hypothetical protein
MSPDEAKEYGLIDHIITGHRGLDKVVAAEEADDPAPEPAPVAAAAPEKSPSAR